MPDSLVLVVVILGNQLVGNVAEHLEPVVLGIERVLELLVLLEQRLDVVERLAEIGELEEGRVRAGRRVDLVGLAVELLELEALIQPGLLGQPGRRDRVVEALELVVALLHLGQGRISQQQLTSQSFDFSKPRVPT